MNETICPDCGRAYAIGEWYRCPHGYGAYAAFHDEIPGGVTVENYGPNPITFYSHSERRAYMKKHHIAERESFAPLPGTDKDPQGIPNPKGYVDPYTREAAITLILRQQNASKEAIDPVAQSRTFSGDVPLGTTRVEQVLELFGK